MNLPPLPDPQPTYCYGDTLRPCNVCGADAWESLGDIDRGDYDEEVFECKNCRNRIYVELPD